MGKVFVSQTISLDGFVATVNDDVAPLFGWYINGDTGLPFPGLPQRFKLSKASAALIAEEWNAIGAFVTGRRDFEVSKAWGGQPPLGKPMFIVTHQPPPEWNQPNSPFTFVTDGVESAIKQAQEAAKGKSVNVGGTKIIQQCLAAGLIDEIGVEVVPVLLGAGIRLFDWVNGKPIELAYTRVVEGKGVTHLRFRVIK